METIASHGQCFSKLSSGQPFSTLPLQKRHSFGRRRAPLKRRVIRHHAVRVYSQAGRGRGMVKIKEDEEESETTDSEPLSGTKKFFKFPVPSKSPGTVKLQNKRQSQAKSNTTVFVAGATGKVGSKTVRELLKLGFSVRASTRNVEKAQALFEDVANSPAGAPGSNDASPFNIFSPAKLFGFFKPKVGKRLEIVECDLENPESIETALSNAGVVVCCIGASEKEVLDVSGPYRIDYKATENLINAASSAEVNHFVLLTSLGTQKLGFPAAVLNLFWGVLLWKAKAEKALMQSGLPYTIVRPGGMERPTDAYKESHNLRLSEADKLFGGQVSKLQVAELLASIVENPDVSVNKIVEAIAETTAPFRPIRELLEAIPSKDVSSPSLKKAKPVTADVDAKKSSKKQEEENNRALALKEKEEKRIQGEKLAEEKRAQAQKEKEEKRIQAERDEKEKQRLQALRRKYEEEIEAAREKEETAKSAAAAALEEKAELEKKAEEIQARAEAAALAASQAKAVEAAVLAAAKQGNVLSDEEKKNIMESVMLARRPKESAPAELPKKKKPAFSFGRWAAPASTTTKTTTETKPSKEGEDEKDAESKVKAEKQKEEKTVKEQEAKKLAEAKKMEEQERLEKEAKKRAEAKQKEEAEARRKEEEEAEAKKKEEEEKAREEAEAKIKEEEEKAREEAEAKRKEEELEEAKKEEEEKAKKEAEAKKKEEELAEAKKEEEEKAKKEAEAKKKEEELAEAKKEEEEKAKKEAEAKKKEEELAEAKKEEEERAKKEAEVLKAQEEEKAKALAKKEAANQAEMLKMQKEEKAKALADEEAAKQVKKERPGPRSKGFRWFWQPADPETPDEEEITKEEAPSVPVEAKTADQLPPCSTPLSPYTRYPGLKPQAPPMASIPTPKSAEEKQPKAEIVSSEVKGVDQATAKVELPAQDKPAVIPEAPSKDIKDDIEEPALISEAPSKGIKDDIEARTQIVQETAEREREALEKAQATIFKFPWQNTETTVEEPAFALKEEKPASQEPANFPEPNTEITVEESAFALKEEKPASSQEPTNSPEPGSSVRAQESVITPQEKTDALPQSSRPLSPYAQFPELKPPNPPAPFSAPQGGSAPAETLTNSTATLSPYPGFPDLKPPTFPAAGENGAMQPLDTREEEKLPESVDSGFKWPWQQ
ncbi:hypothetical protein L7F22_036727 [Adiantum nelumboides]|nr:hypothetical protein [Adiantum nelumboides]